MNVPRIKVKVVEAAGTYRGDTTSINPPKAAGEILQASGCVGNLRNSLGHCLSGSDPVDDSQQCTLKLAPAGDLLTACLYAIVRSLRGLLLTLQQLELKCSSI